MQMHTLASVLWGYRRFADNFKSLMNYKNKTLKIFFYFFYQLEPILDEYSLNFYTISYTHNHQNG